ncbi:MAG: SDR family oxidoreductase [Candidatus Acidiferrales bacterium]
MILITGASGGVGSAVLAEVSKAGLPFKAMYRNEADARKAGGAKTVIADFSNKESLRRALAGVDTVFLVCSPIPELVELEGNAIDVCKETGVRHVVLNSALGAGDYQKSFPSLHGKVEDKLKTSGLGYTILRPNSFMQNIIAYLAPSIRAQGAFYSAAGNSRYSYLDVRDIAAAAAKILVSPAAHEAKTYELNGPEAVTNTELAQRISRVAGRTVKFVDIPEEAQRKSMLEMGMPEWFVTALLDLQRYYTAGHGGEVTDVLAKLLGRGPITLDQFLGEFKDSFNAQAAGV